MSRACGSATPIVTMIRAPAASPPVLSLQRFQQRPGVPEVRRVKALREPAVHLRQELTGFSTFTLALPQAAQAHGGAQLPRPGLLAAGNGQGLLQAGFCL